MDVERLQQCLDHIFKLKGKKKIESTEPAFYGCLTAYYVCIFQQKCNIAENGTFNNITRTKLREVIECR